MAIFHLSIKIIGRSGGRSIIAAAAYRSGTRIKDDETGIVHDFRRKHGVTYSEIMLCEHAPPDYRSRKELWSSVQRVEKSKDAQLAREIEIALPEELDRSQQIDLVRTYIKETFVSMGMCADICIHSKESDNPHSNPHAHVLLTTRGIAADGSWAPKERKAYALDDDGKRIPVIDPATGHQKTGPRNQKIWKRVSVRTNYWNSTDMADHWRKAWEDAVNRKLSECGFVVRIDHRSYKRQGLNILPTKHEGYAAREIERRGGISEICEENRQIRVWNTSISRIMSAETDIAEELHTLMERKEMVNERTKRIIQRRNADQDGGRTTDRDRADEAKKPGFVEGKRAVDRVRNSDRESLPKAVGKARIKL